MILCVKFAAPATKEEWLWARAVCLSRIGRGHRPTTVSYGFYYKAYGLSSGRKRRAAQPWLKTRIPAPFQC